MTWRTHDIGAIIKGASALDPIAATSAGGEVNGLTIDRADQTTVSHPYRSAKIIIPYSCILGSSTGSMVVLANVQESTSSTAWVDYSDKDGSTGVGTTVSNTAAGGSTNTGVLEFDVDLGSAGRYFRVQVNRTVTSTADSLAFGAVAVLGGGVEHPAQ